MNDVPFGLTREGGRSNEGTIFRMDPDGGGYKILHRFAGPDGAYPCEGVSLGQSRPLCGTTMAGGGRNKGVIFSHKPVFTAIISDAKALKIDGERLLWLEVFNTLSEKTYEVQLGEALDDLSTVSSVIGSGRITVATVPIGMMSGSVRVGEK